jgi:hypothetical protein
MKDDSTVPVPLQAAPDSMAMYGSALTGDVGDAADPAADRAGPTVPGLTVPSVSAAPMEPLDIRALLHPSEHSRLLLALAASAVVFGFAAMAVYASLGWTVVVEFVGYLAAFGALVWLSLQVFRSRLLGGAVRVSETTLPELQSVFDEVRARLNYLKPVDVYVMDKVGGGSVMTSYLGTRLIQIEGGLVADLLGEAHHAELRFMIGRHIGQLKARHQRLLPIMLAISLVDSLKFLQLFLAPYYRATAKSGDQIAAACCGDIQATAGMMNRLLAGKELGPRLFVKGILDQAAIVRRRWLPRLAQLFMSEPHATNRYLNLLAFFARVAPEEIGRWRASLDEATASRITAAINASAHRQAPRRRMSLASVLVATLVSGGLLALSGWAIFGAASQNAISPGGQSSAAHTPAAGHANAAAQQLLAHIPPSFATTCKPIAVPAVDAAQGADAEAICQPGALGDGGYLQYAQYRGQGAMQSAYAGLAHGLPPGDCTSVPGQGSYPPGSASQSAGDLACESNSTGQHVFLWTDSHLAILGVAVSTSMTFADLHQWWQSASGPEPAAPGSQATSPQPEIGIPATLSAYFDAINARDYRLAWSELSPTNQEANPYQQFAAGVSTTTIQDLQLHGIAVGSLPGTFIASVTFRSYQDPSEAPNHNDSCDDWTLDYTMIQSSGRWLIDNATSQPGVPDYQSCG